jgi:hypothetical protein
MVENEAKIYDAKIDLQPVNPENTNPILGLRLKNADLTTSFEKIGSNQILRFARKRKIKRTKSSGIF